MIVVRVPGGLRVVTQVAHQHQCALIARQWGNAAFARPEPWEDVVMATGVHDEGWREREGHPALLPDGAPRGFTDMPIHEHVAIHRASAAAARALGDRAGLLVGMHGAGLVMRRMGIDGAMPDLAGRPTAVRDLVHEHAGLARAQRARIGEGVQVAGWAWAAYRVLQAIDLLSLYLTWTGLAEGQQWTLARVPRAPGDEAGVDIRVAPAGPASCTLDPWPLARDVVQAPVAARTIADRPYRDPDDLARTLRDARVEIVGFRVARPSART